LLSVRELAKHLRWQMNWNDAALGAGLADVLARLPCRLLLLKVEESFRFISRAVTLNVSSSAPRSAASSNTSCADRPGSVLKYPRPPASRNVLTIVHPLAVLPALDRFPACASPDARAAACLTVSNWRIT
jgi:hypothetical protein